MYTDESISRIYHLDMYIQSLQRTVNKYTLHQETVAVLCGWEGNRRFRVTLAMIHRLYGLNCLRKGDEYAICTPAANE